MAHPVRIPARSPRARSSAASSAGRFWIFLGLAGPIAGLACTPGLRPAGEVITRGDEVSPTERFTVRYRADVNPIHRVVALPVNRVWAALPRAFEALHYPGAPSDQADERVFLTPYLVLRGSLYEGELNSVYLDCGRNPLGASVADSWRITFAILVRLTPQGEGRTAVDVLIDGNANDPVLRANSQHCSGTGRLEEALLDLIERYASASAP